MLRLGFSPVAFASICHESPECHSNADFLRPSETFPALNNGLEPELESGKCQCSKTSG